MNKYEINALIEYIKAEIDAKIAEYHSIPTQAQDRRETAKTYEIILRSVLKEHRG